MNFWGYIKKNLKYLLTSCVFSLLFLGGFPSVQGSDLLWQAVEPSYRGNTIITMGEGVDKVGKSVVEGSDVDVTLHGAFTKASVIVKATRILLSLVIALAITMILYNGMMYIIQTGQGKEAKDLTKNIAYIVIGILVALFSVVIITLIQSIPNTLENELISDQDSSEDNKVVKDVGKRIW